MSGIPPPAGAEQSLQNLAAAALRRTRRFDAVLLHARGLPAPVVAGATDRPEELAAIAEAVAASGQEVVADGEAEAAGRSPQCYLGLTSLLGFPLVHDGAIVGAAVAESGQIGPFSQGEIEALRALATDAARLLA